MDERSSVRVVSDLEVDFHAGASTGRAVLYNVSAGGCMLGIASEIPEELEFLCVKLAGLLIDGHIVWRRGGGVGVRFLRGVHPVLVDQLAFRDRRRR